MTDAREAEIVAWLRERGDVERAGAKYTLRERLRLAWIALVDPNIVWCGAYHAVANTIERGNHRSDRDG